MAFYLFLRTIILVFRNFVITISSCARLFAVGNQNSLKGAKDVTKVIDFAQVSRFHTPNNTELVRKANKSGWKKWWLTGSLYHFSYPLMSLKGCHPGLPSCTQFVHQLVTVSTFSEMFKSSCFFRCPVSISVTTMVSKNCFNFGSMDLHQYCSSNCIGKSIKPTLVLIIKVAHFSSLHANCVFTCS